MKVIKILKVIQKVNLIVLLPSAFHVIKRDVGLVEVLGLRQNGTLGVDADDFAVGTLFLEFASHATYGSAGSSAQDHHINLNNI